MILRENLSFDVSSYRFERVSETNLHNLVSIFEANNGFSQSLSYFKSKFNTGYTGVSYVGFFAFSPEGEPAAFYGVYPCFINLNGSAVLAAQSGDTITHSSHQRRGLFVLLANLTYQLAQELGIRYVFGFPNSNSLHGFVNKLDFIKVGAIVRYDFDVSTIPYTKILRRLKLNAVDIFFKELILDKFKVGYPGEKEETVSCLRNFEYFQYKNFTGGRIIEYRDFYFWLKIDELLFIGDIYSKSSRPLTEAISEIKSLAKILGIAKIIFEVTRDSIADMHLRKHYSSVESCPIIVKSLGESQIVNDWNFTGGDVDTF